MIIYIHKYIIFGKRLDLKNQKYSKNKSKIEIKSKTINYKIKINVCVRWAFDY